MATSPFHRRLESFKTPLEIGELCCVEHLVRERYQAPRLLDSAERGIVPHTLRLALEQSHCVCGRPQLRRGRSVLPLHCRAS